MENFANKTQKYELVWDEACVIRNYHSQDEQIQTTGHAQ